MSDLVKIYTFFTRYSFPATDFSFDVILTEAIERCLFKTDVERDIYFEANVKRIWNYVKKTQYELCKEKSILPLFSIQQESTRIIRCYVNDCFQKTLDKKYYFLKSRPNILNEIDLLSHREYEALSILLCENLSANNTLLTPRGNEGGIDFIATIKFSETSHFLFGVNGPIRIIGQCKKYNTAVQVDKVKEFNSTIGDVHRLYPKVKNVLPLWFLQSKGPIIGWIISHSGFQQGAKNRAKDFGLILSDTLEIGEVFSSSKKFFQNMPYDMRHKQIKKGVQDILLR